MKQSSKKQEQKQVVCIRDHAMAPVLIAGKGMRLLCACDGYAPIDMTKPYMQLKAPEAQGKACLPRKDRGCILQGR